MANKLNSGIPTFTLSERVADFERVQEVLASIRVSSFFDASIDLQFDAYIAQQEQEEKRITPHLVALNLVMNELSDKYGFQPFDVFKAIDMRFKAFDKNDSSLLYSFEGHFIECFRCIAISLRNILGLDNGVLEQFRVGRALNRISKLGGGV